MGVVRNVFRPLVPRLIRQKFREAQVRRELKTWQALDLHHETAGLIVRVSSKSDWTVFNEIFVEGIYDRAIADVLGRGSKNGKLSIVDLGANVGFFALRFSQKVFQSENPDQPFAMYCVEGSPRVYTELAARVADNPRLEGHINTRLGLVGRRSGWATFYESSFGAGNTTAYQHWSKPTKVLYVDLETLIPADEPITLLKCDIEGSEQVFQDTYHDLLLRTQSAVVELHHYYISPEKFHEGMTKLGFSRREALWESENKDASLFFYKQERKEN